MTHPRKLVVAVLILGLALFAAGCKKPTTPEDIAPPPPQAEPAKPPAPPTEPKTEVEDFKSEPVATSTLPTDDQKALWNSQGVLKTVYFAFDRYDLDDPARAVLQGNASWLGGVGKQVDIRVEGHCDERGTIEYNLALGERRASAAREYLVSLGVDASRVRIVSFGEEQPADPGHSEAAWAKNRRAQFVIE